MHCLAHDTLLIELAKRELSPSSDVGTGIDSSDCRNQPGLCVPPKHPFKMLNKTPALTSIVVYIFTPENAAQLESTREFSRRMFGLLFNPPAASPAIQICSQWRLSKKGAVKGV